MARPRRIHYFAYGTLQRGFANYADLEDVLGDPAGRFRTVDPYAIVVPHEPGCLNPACALLHRMATLVPDADDLHAEGDVYEIDAGALRRIDALESYDDHAPGPYIRQELALIALGSPTRLNAHAYRASDPARWRSLVDAGRADAVTRYAADVAASQPKPCCTRHPGHAPPHDVTDPTRPAAPGGGASPVGDAQSS